MIKKAAKRRGASSGPAENPKLAHLRVYEEMSVLYGPEQTRLQEFLEGSQSDQARKRYTRICEKFEKGFLKDVIDNCRAGRVNFDPLSAEQKELLNRLVSGITSERGRALVGLSVLQLAVKAIEPAQSVRLHKAGAGFSWAEGLSMRTLDASYVTPVLRQEDLMRVNKFGVMMTRGLAENYPYTRFYKASLRGSKQEWLELADLMEIGKINPQAALEYLIHLLIKKSQEFQSMASDVVNLCGKRAQKIANLDEVTQLIKSHMETPALPAARLLEVSMHSLLQAVEELGGLRGLELRPMSQMRQADKKAGGVAEIELTVGGAVVEGWDAKFGKSYLYDELQELRDKLEQGPKVSLKVFGFVTDKEPDLRDDVKEELDNIRDDYEIEAVILSFDDWVRKQAERVPKEKQPELAKRWLLAYGESLALRRPEKAPIDEPTEGWLKALQELLRK